jgi:tetratricopeptide (TPR) repeat protein
MLMVAAGGRRTLVLAVLALVVVTGLVYAQVAGFAFLNYDDDKFLLDNDAIQQGLTATSVAWAFTNNHASLWLPVTWISHTVDFALFGRDPAGHHLVNLCQHLLNTVLLLVFLVRTSGRPGPALLVAGLFALHPLHVESVAWVTERKDTLSTLFLLVTMLGYARWTRGGSRSAGALALAACALGLMAKPMLVTVPLLLLVLDLWPLQRLGVGWRRLAREKIPYLAMALATGVATLLVGRAGGIVAGLDSLPVWPRIANALVSTATYPLQMVWPLGLRAQYAFRHDLPPLQVAGAALFLGVITWLAVRWWRPRPWFTAGWAWYLVSLAPVSGLLQQGSHAMADRYTYVPLIGVFWMVAWGLAALVGDRPERRRAAWTAGAVVLAVLGLLTHRQAATWRDTVTLFSHAHAQAPDDPVVLTYLGGGLAGEGRHDEATARLREALDLEPDLHTAHLLLARSLAALGDHARAARHFGAALPAYEGLVAVRYDMGVQLMQAGEAAAAITAFEGVLAAEPGHTGALTNLGLTLLSQDRFAAAEATLRRLVDAAPQSPLSHYNLACALSRAGDTAAAADALGRAVALGFADWAHMGSDPDLANLRASPDYARVRP